jgi:hypothetical protein
MTSPKQEAANRRNALQSTGPRSAVGRAASRLNAVNHGLTGESPLIPGESEEEAVEFVQSVITDLDPLGSLQEELAREVAVCSWRLRRAARVEAGLYQQFILLDIPQRKSEEAALRPRIGPELKKKLGYKAPPPRSEEEMEEWAQKIKHRELGEAFLHDSSGSNAFLKLSRYETALSRRRDRALLTLLALQSANRPELDH